MAKQSTKKTAKKKTARKSDPPGPDTTWHKHDRFGLFIHWGIYAGGARGEWLKKSEGMTDEQYQQYYDNFNPDLYDPREWARLAKNAGMKYFAITTKHHDGFCLWDSKLTDYKSTNTPYGKDLLKPMVKAFRDEGLSTCLYHSLIDWHHPHFTIDQFHPQSPYPHIEKFPQINRKRDMAIYRKYLHGQVRELMTQFGEIKMTWFDFSYVSPEGFPNKLRDDWDSEKLVKMVRELQPGIMINNRLDLPGEPDFVTPEQYQPLEWPTNKKGDKQVWEACQTFSGHWGYSRDEGGWKSVRMLIWMLIDTVSKGGNLLLNVGPTGRGDFDQRAIDRLEGMGRWMQVNSRSIYGCTQSDFTPPVDSRYTQNGKHLFLHLINYPFRHVYLPDMKGKVAYAKFLHDASEIKMITEPDRMAHPDLNAPGEDGHLRLEIPIEQPDVEIPVIELILK
jgi:alpha-L-fucosidase